MNGRLPFSPVAARLSSGLTANATPAAWTKQAHADLPPAHQLRAPRPLASWIARLHAAAAQLAAFAVSLQVPLVTWMPGLFSPVAFLTAVKQSLAGGAAKSLDELILGVEVTGAATADAVGTPTARGVYVSGLHLSGARWDAGAAGGAGALAECGRELESPLPVALLCCGTADADGGGGGGGGGGGPYKCPAYHLSARGTSPLDIDARLPSGEPPGKWLLAGVAIFLEKVAGL